MIFTSVKQDIHMFDTSDSPEDNVYNIPRVNKKVLGVWKDECLSKLLFEFSALKSKAYAIRVEGEGEKKRAKGVKSSVVNKTIKFDDYVACLENEREISRKQNYIRSKLHKVYTVCEEKIALSYFDNKRYLIKNCTDTLPWEHKDVME